MEYIKFKVQDFGSIRKITLDNEKKKNAFDFYSYSFLPKLLKNAENDENIKCVVLTGKGDFFSSGNDLTQDFSIFKEFEVIREFMEAFIKFPKILIALVNGPAIGIAATILGLVDIVYCHESAYILTPFTRLGIAAEGCSSHLFPLIMGSSKANEMLLLSKSMSAQEAYHFGLVSKVYKNEAEIWEKLKEIDELPIGSLIANKKLIRRPKIKMLMKICNEEMDENDRRRNTEEAIMAVLKFQQKRGKKAKL